MGNPGIGVLVTSLLVLAACSGSGTASEAGPTTLPRAVATTTVRPRTATTTTTRATTPTTRPEFSFDDSVPPPKLVNTGTDYVAILKSLEAYGNWLAAHRPDPALAVTTVAPGTKLLSDYVHDITILRDNNKREVEELNAPSTYTIISVSKDAFSARVIENISVHRVIDPMGNVSDERRYTGATTYLDLVVLAGGHWYLAGIDAA